MNEFTRTEMLLGETNMSKLKDSHVAVFGVGGVGGNCIEALVRSGVHTISIFDNDTVSLTNLNRQVIALHSTIGKKKTEVMKERLLDINPSLKINAYDMFVSKENFHEIDFSDFDYVVDAIDTVSAKLLIIEKCKEVNIPIISSMGTGNKLDPTQLKIMDLSKTSYCPLAKVMRHELKKRNIRKLKVLASLEQPLKPLKISEETCDKRSIPASCAFVPSVAGLIICSEVIKDLIHKS